MDILAQLEVKVINKEWNLKAELKEIEQNKWEKNEGLSIAPRSGIEKNYFDKIISDLRKIKVVRKGLDI